MPHDTEAGESEQTLRDDAVVVGVAGQKKHVVNGAGLIYERVNANGSSPRIPGSDFLNPPAPMTLTSYEGAPER